MVGRQFQTSKWWVQIFYLVFFFTILYHLPDCKMVSDRLWMFYGIAEKPRPTGNCVKCAPATWGLSSQLTFWIFGFFTFHPASVTKGSCGSKSAVPLVVVLFLFFTLKRSSSAHSYAVSTTTHKWHIYSQGQAWHLVVVGVLWSSYCVPVIITTPFAQCFF